MGNDPKEIPDEFKGKAVILSGTKIAQRGSDGNWYWIMTSTVSKVLTDKVVRDFIRWEQGKVIPSDLTFP